MQTPNKNSEEVICGLNNSPFNPTLEMDRMNHLLYYDDGRLTDDYYIKHPRIYIDGEFVKNGKVYCYGNINIGDYVTTCPFYGVSMVATNSDVAFAIALSSYNTNSDEEYKPVGLIDVDFL